MFDFGLNPDQEARAKTLHDESIVIDMLTESSFTNSLFPDMLAGGLTCGSFTIGTAGLAQFQSGALPKHEDWWTREATVADIAVFEGIFRDPSNGITQIRSAADIERAKA